MILRLLVLVLSTPSIWAKSLELPKNVGELRARCQAVRTLAPVLPLAAPTQGEILSVSVSSIDAGQTRFSFQRVQNNFAKLLKKNGENVRPYDRGQSAFPPDYRKIKGVYFNGRIRLVDGHHHALAAIFAGSTTLPVEIVADVSHIPPHFLNQHLWQNGYAYPLSASGSWERIPDLCELGEDSYLNFAQFLMQRVKVQRVDGQWEVLSAKGAELAILLKLNSDIPFLELEVADALHRGGYGAKDPNEPQISRGELIKILKILHQQAPNSRLQYALLLPRPMEFRKKKYRDLIEAHLRKPNPCAHFLSET